MFKLGIHFLLLFIFLACNRHPTMNEDLQTTLSIEQKVDSLLRQMTLTEKIGQMTQVRHFDDIKDADIADKFIGSVIHTQGTLPGQSAAEWQERFKQLQKLARSTRLQIPLLFGVDAVHGQNTFEGATIFPHNIGLGAAHNPELVERAAAITAIEAQATGFNWVFSPCVAIPFNEKWGRVYEAFSEDPARTATLTAASVRGHQGSLSGSETVMATAKHFIGDGATDFGLEGGNTTFSKSSIMELLLPPYQAALDAGVGSVMASFNTLNSVPMHANKEMITDVLKDSLKFDGIVVSDWKGYSRFGGIDIIDAGIDMVMAVDGDLADFQHGLKQAVENGRIAQSRIDDAVRRILRQKFRLGLFDNPFPNSGLIDKIGIQEHRAVARQAVRESLVLLKNTDKALPLKKSDKVVVVGEFAANSGLQSGGWTVNWQGMTEDYKGATTIIEGIERYADTDVLYDIDGTGQHSKADVAVIVVGETPYAEFFGDVGGEMDIYQLTLTEKHQEYVDVYAKLGMKVVVLLISGRPLVVSRQIEQSDAFVAAWLPGSEGDGIAEVLYGDYDFKGTLPHSWPRSENDFKGKYGPNFWDKSIEPLFPIGFGLNYRKNE
jgi:beta-glucosidase